MKGQRLAHPQLFGLTTHKSYEFSHCPTPLLLMRLSRTKTYRPSYPDPLSPRNQPGQDWNISCIAHVMCQFSGHGKNWNSRSSIHMVSSRHWGGYKFHRETLCALCSTACEQQEIGLVEPKRSSSLGSVLSVNPVWPVVHQRSVSIAVTIDKAMVWVGLHDPGLPTVWE